jgi:opacity protein-like surface antigen
MRWSSAVGAIAVMLVVFSVTTVHAEDTRHKWQFGLGFSYWSTDDSIRSNSATAFAPVDPSQAGNLPPITFSDPRPDANELNEATIHDSFKADFQASYGLTRWVAIRLDLSYFKGDVGNIEYYSEDKTIPVSAIQQAPNTADPSQPDYPNPDNDPALRGFKICEPIDGTPPVGPLVKPCYSLTGGTTNLVKRNAFLPVGSITEAPVSLSGVVRFRPESPFDPYVGAGVGYIFTSLDTAASSMSTPLVMTASDISGTNRVVTMKGFQDVENFTNGLVVQNIRAGARAVLSYPCHQVSFHPSVCTPTTDRIITSDGGTPLVGLTASVDSAMEYHLMGGVDYYFTDRWSVYIDARYVWAQSKVSVRIDNQTQVITGIKDYGCQNGAPHCNTVNRGNLDTSNAVITNATADDIQDSLIIQGGDIKLGGFSIGVGAKVTF